MTPQEKVEKRLGTIKALARVGCSNEEISALIGVGVTTLKRHAQHVLKRGRAHIRRFIRQKQLEILERGDTKMAIWLGMQWCGQRDTRHLEVKRTGPPKIARALQVILNAPQQQLDALIQQDEQALSQVGIVDVVSLPAPSEAIGSHPPVPDLSNVSEPASLAAAVPVSSVPLGPPQGPPTPAICPEPKGSEAEAIVDQVEAEVRALLEQL